MRHAISMSALAALLALPVAPGAGRAQDHCYTCACAPALAGCYAYCQDYAFYGYRECTGGGWSGNCNFHNSMECIWEAGVSEIGLDGAQLNVQPADLSASGARGCGLGSLREAALKAGADRHSARIELDL
jgi:hypothetical protein